MSLLTCMDTARYFITEESSVSTDSDADLNYNSQGWPPFRKVGNFDPFTDDPRYAVKTVELCSKTGLLVVGGLAGQLLLCHLDSKRVRTVLGRAASHCFSCRNLISR